MSYGIERYTREANRLYGVLDGHLADSAYLAGSDYSIADIATFPWLRSHGKQGVKLSDYPHVERWFGGISERPAVQRGLEVMAREQTAPQDEQKRFENLFGNRQFRRT